MKKSKQLVFIDDSGDPGFTKGTSSSNFVLAAALFIDSETATLVNDAISEYRRSLGWQDETEFKFSKSRKEVVAKLLRIVVRYDFQIYAVYLNKADYPEVFRSANLSEKTYNWATKELLATMPLEGAQVKIDGKYDKGYKNRVKAYLRRELNTDVYRLADFDAQDSKQDNLIQLADLIVGAINRSMHPEKTDARKYLAILTKKVAGIKRLELDDD